MMILKTEWKQFFCRPMVTLYISVRFQVVPQNGVGVGLGVTV